MPDYVPLVRGSAVGSLIVLDEPLSLWGGLSPEDGRITDPHHPQHGVTLTGLIVCMPHGRGSSSSSSILAEALRLGTGPAGFILQESDPILVIGSLVAGHLYQSSCPILLGPIPSLTGGRWGIDCDNSACLLKLDG